MEQDRVFEDNNEEPSVEPKMTHQKTTKCLNTQNSPSTLSFDFDACIRDSTDTSFEQTLHQENV